MRHFIFILFLHVFLVIPAQELPPIEKFTASDYGGDNQNWMISQNQDNYIYAANNKGLLEYNGSSWVAYPSPNNTILRAVNVIDDRIYTGCYEEFGYWLKDKKGVLNYTSLLPKLNENAINDDQIWNILDFNEWVLFQSGHTLYFFNKETEQFKIINSEQIIYKVFNINGHIYYHVANEGIYLLKDGQPKLIINDAVVIEDRVINIWLVDEVLTILTRNTGFFQLKNNKLEPWEISANNRVKKLNIFNSIRLEDHSFVIGTISNGVIKINNKGELDYAINQKLGLSNNTVLALFEDSNQNVWAGLDNGINCINMTSPIQTFIDYDGVLGTVYSTIIFKDLLYVGTNQGLFYRSLITVDETFRFVEGTAGQVWSLFNDNNERLICGHHLGTFIVDKNGVEKISSELGAWNFKKIPNHDNLLLQGNYDGLYVLEYKDNTWGLRNKIENFKNSSRFFEINNTNQIFVNHEYKGVFILNMNSDFTKTIKVEEVSELTIGNSSSLESYQGDILYTSENGIYNYSDAENKFVKNNVLTDLMASKKFTSGKIVVDQTGKLWLFFKNNISYITNDNITNIPQISDIAIPSDLRKGVLGFENLQHIEGEKYILGTVNGYLTLDLANIETYSSSTHSIHLNSIMKKDVNGSTNYLPLAEDGSFQHEKGIVSFSFSVPEYNKFLDVSYSYKLSGLSDKWSEWSHVSSVQFENLSFGDYTLEVRGRVGNQLTENFISYDFEVNRPWYISNVAILLYVLILIGIAFLVNKVYKFYYERILKHEHIKNERALIQIKNEKLNQDIEGKNRELVISTMSIIKKNELLNKIKKELKRTRNNKDIESAIDLIDTNLNNNKDWKFFKEAFNNADKDFMDKIKAAHPDLTPNDLKFCAYLRLNLSSKEMAPLLNISIKSVETKRYRLRKRLQLDHDDSLVNYILKF
ncbi:helix-turn-helix and ligand-binding sensor domain-containing protein [Winogradskyella helgolandensis]|uniref:helix-turn-helix and ligand-binding sensor domain-containing protein n=1 Tax=Winogradskyella helgolandensis TaxID=2697010 RepID=UPI0015BCC0C2|nr:triple tyrosine motif-containing protein [Winogradskyella helgolandensis]